MEECSGIPSIVEIDQVAGKDQAPSAYSFVIRRTMLGRSEAAAAVDSRKAVIVENLVSYVF